MFLEVIIGHSNALAHITRRLIGQRQKIATIIYSAIYRRKPDVMSNVGFDW